MYSKAYIDYLVHFHGDRDYFECHEIIEEYWKDVKGNKQSFYVGLLLLAVSNYHYRRDNKHGAYKTLKKAITILKNQKQFGCTLGIEVNSLLVFLEKRILHIQSGRPYTSFNLPLTNKDLIRHCQKVCKDKGFIWGNPSILDDDNLVHRHKMRDRSAIVQERNAALLKKSRKKSRE